MITIKTRKVGEYVNIDIEVDGFHKDMGLLDERERKELTQELKEVVWDLESYDK